MSYSGRLAVLAHGMVTAAGNDGASTCAAMRAGVSAITEANLWDRTVGARLSAGRPQLHQWWEGPSMLGVLAAPAVQQCFDAVAEIGEHIDPDAVPIVIILPPGDRPLRPANLEQRVSDDLARTLGRALPRGSSVVAEGRTGIFSALEIANQRVTESDARMCVIVGVESFLRQVIVNHYIDEGRLLCGINSNGFIPGEAACAVLVGPANEFSCPKLVIAGCGVGAEQNGTGGDVDTPVTGDGLTKAFRGALAGAGIEYYQIQATTSDLNGEHFKFKEATIAAARVNRVPPAGVPLRPQGYVEIWHPVEFLGEIGAAVFPCMLGLVLEAGRKGYAPDVHMLLHASEDDGSRVALVARFEQGTVVH